MRILIVDDDSLNRFLIMHMLEQEGYTDCFEAESGDQAIEQMAKHNVDLVLLDVVMPGMDGFETAPILKKMGGDIYLPIIFITALDDEESLARCLSVGGDDFVGKPFNKVILSAKIKAHARTRQLSADTYQQNRALTYHQNNINREHRIVEHIFSNVLTLDKRLTKYLDYRLAPASNFNGDLLLVEKSPTGTLYTLLGDFTGHGLASAIGALPVARAFQTMSAKGLPISEIAETLNKTLLDFLPGDMFFAAAIIEISDQGKQLTIWNGGLPNLIVIDSQGEVVQRFESAHMALGILDPEDFEGTVERYEGNFGDKLFGYTDGLIELQNEDNHMLGEEGFEQWLLADPSIDTQGIGEKVEQYRGGEEQADDITLLSYAFQPLKLEIDEIKMPAVPFDLHMSVCVEKMQAHQPVFELIELISGHNALHHVRADIFTVVSELYNNSLDHGILGIDSALKDSPDGFFEFFEKREQALSELQEGHIDIYLSYCPEARTLTVTVKDSGSGFATSQLHSECDSDESHGRGVALVKELTQSLQYSENGTKAEAVFAL